MRACIATIAGLLALALAASPASGERGATEAAAFVGTAAGRGLAYVELSELALQRSQNAVVRRLARRIIDEHLHGYDDLLWLASASGTEAPSTIDLEQRGIKSRLATLSGAEFDRAYLQALLTNDARDIALYRAYAERGRDEELKKWAAERLPTLRRQRQLASAAMAEVARPPATP